MQINLIYFTIVALIVSKMVETVETILCCVYWGAYTYKNIPEPTT